MNLVKYGWLDIHYIFLGVYIGLSPRLVKNKATQVFLVRGFYLPAYLWEAL